MPLLDMFPRALAGTVPTTTQSLAPETAPQGAGRPLNPMAVDALRTLSATPEFKERVSPDRQKKVQLILAGVGPDNKLYKYGKDSGIKELGVAEFLNKKFNPLVPNEQFAPGEQSIYGDIFSRPVKGIVKGTRALRGRNASLFVEFDKSDAAIDEEYKNTPFYAGKPNDYKQKKLDARELLKQNFEEGQDKTQLETFLPEAKEGAQYPRAVPTLQEEGIEEYYSRPEVGTAMAQGGLPAAGAVARGFGESAKGLARDILHNPADLALMFAPVPKALQRVGDIPVGKGFKAGVKNVFRPAAAAGKTSVAGVSSAEQSIKANLGKTKAPVEGAGGQLEFPFVKGAAKKPVVTAADDAAKAAATKIDDAVRQVNASKVSAAQKDAALKKIQGLAEPKTPKQLGQKEFKFTKPKPKPKKVRAKKNVIEKAAAKETPGQTLEKMFPDLGKAKIPDITKGTKVKPKVVKAPKKVVKKKVVKKKLGKKGQAEFDTDDIKPPSRIISGGQTGADRAGLEAGKKLGIETGGLAPKGFKTEKGADPLLKSFGLTEHTSSDYVARTIQNVKNSDITAVFGDVTSAGSKLTINTAKRLKKPVLINPTAEELRAAASGKVLNIAGNRASKAPNLQATVEKTLTDAFGKSDPPSAFKSAVKKFKDKTGAKKISDGTPEDDLVKAFKNVLPDIIDDVKANGGTVMDRITAMTDDAGKPLANEAVLKMVAKEIGESAAAAKAEVTRHGNWNLKNIKEKLRKSVIEMAERDKSLTKKGPEITDIQVKKMAANMQETPTVRAILKGKPGKLAAEVRKQVDDAVASLKAVVDEDLGPTGLHKKLMEVVKKRFIEQKEVSSRMGRAFRQNQLTADDAVEIRSIIKGAINKYKDDPLMHPDDFKAINQGLLKLQDDLLNTSNIKEFMDKTYYTWLNGLLSNPFTHGVNFISNAAFMLEKFPNRFFDVLGDATVRMYARGKGVKLDPVFKFREIPAMFRGFTRWASRSAQGRGQPFKIRKGTKLDIDLPSPLSKSWERIIGTPVRALKKGDEFFKEAVGYMEYFARHVAGERGDNLLNSIYSEQLHRTFQDPASALGKGLMNMKNTIPGLRYIIPFINTPDRILLRTLERTIPGALAKLGTRIAKGASQKELAQSVGLVYQSVLLTAGVAHLWNTSAIHGDAPENESERVAFYESGKKANSIKIGKFWIPFNRIEPIGGALSIMVNFIQDIENSEQEATLEKIIEGIGGTTQSLMNKTYYQGILGLMRAATEAHIYGGKWVGKIAGSGVPASGLMRFFAQFIDPVYRSPDTVVEKVMTGIPLLSKKVQPTLGAFGDIQNRTFLGIGKEEEDKLTKALKDTPVPMPSRRIAGEKMSMKEYNTILIKSGPFLKDALTELTNSPTWSKLPRGIREDAVNKVSRDIRGMYRSELRMQKIYQQIKDGPDDYLNSFLE